MSSVTIVMSTITRTRPDAAHGDPVESSLPSFPYFIPLRFALAAAMAVLATLLGALLLGGCGGGGGGSSSAPVQVAPPPGGQSIFLTGGTIEIPPDVALADPTSAADRSRLGVAGFERSFTLTTPAGEPIDLGLTASVPGARGGVSVKVAVAGSATSGAAGTDLQTTGLVARAGNLIDSSNYVETVGDGFARITLAGRIMADTVLVLEREAGGTKTHSVVTLKIGPRGPANPSFPNGTAYTGVISTTPLFSSVNPLFGLPAIAASGDRVSVICYDSVDLYQGGPGPAPGPAMGACVMPMIERRQRRLQLDTITGQATQGETAVLGNDSSFWRDTEVAGLFNVLAIVQSGDDGVNVALSFDRGATFPQTLDLGPGAWSRLVAIDMANDYTTGVLYWGMSQNRQQLTFIEGRPSAWDPNNPNSPTAFSFGAPQILLTRSMNAMPLVSDVKYSSCGDLFLAYGIMEQGAPPPPPAMTRMVTTVGCFRRYVGQISIEGPVTVDQMEIFGYDPSLAITDGTCGGTAEVFVAYEAQDGVRIKRSGDGARSFSSETRVGTTSANAPRLFARTSGGKTVVDCLLLDPSPNGYGSDLCLLRVDGDLASNRSFHRVVEAKVLPGGLLFESVGWFGFDATELNGDLFVAVHTQRTEYYSRTMMGAPGGGMATASAPAPPPPVLLPGMTQPVPAVDPNAAHKLSVLRLD